MSGVDEQDRCSDCIFKIDCLLYFPAPCTVRHVPLHKLFDIYSPATVNKIVHTILDLAKAPKEKS